MQAPRPTLLAEQKAKQLRNAGCKLTDSDILALYSLADRATNGAQDDRLLFFPHKIIGGAEIHPLSLAAKIWLNTQAIEWFAGDRDAQTAAKIYAHHYSRRPKWLQFANPTEARKAIAGLFKTIAATPEEILDAIEELEALEPKGKGDETPKCVNCAGMKSTGVCGKLEAVAQMSGPNVSPDFCCKHYKPRTDTKQSGAGVILTLLHYYFPGHDDDYWLAKPDFVLAQTIARAADMEAAKAGRNGDNFDRQDPCLIASGQLNELCAAIRAREEGADNG